MRVVITENLSALFCNAETKIRGVVERNTKKLSDVNERGDVAEHALTICSEIGGEYESV